MPFLHLVIVLTTVLITTPVSGQSIISFDFPGGTLAEYVDAVRRAAGEVNIVVSPIAEPARFEAVSLTKVSLRGALKLLEGHHTLPSKSVVDVNFVAVSSGDEELARSGELTIYKLEARPVRGRDAGNMGSHVWSLAEILDAGQDPQHVLTAIEAALELDGDVQVPAKLRFHRETRLLLARGTSEQLVVIESLLDELRQGQHSVQTKQWGDLGGKLEDYRTRLEALEMQRGAWQQEMRRLRGARTELEERIETLESRDKER